MQRVTWWRSLRRLHTSTVRRRFYFEAADSVVPLHWQARLKRWEVEKQLQQERQGNQNVTPIKVTVKDVTYTTSTGITPMQLEKGKLLGGALVALVDGQPWDLKRPMTRDCTLEYAEWDHPLAVSTLRHSAAHVLGQAVEYHYAQDQVLLQDGPATDTGFFYDTLISDPEAAAVTVAPEHLTSIEDVAQSIILDKQPFERLEVSLETARELFAYNKFKLRILDQIGHNGDGESVTLYRCGPLIDLCRGPHIPHTGRIKGFHLYSASGNVQQDDREVLQRIYGVAFPVKKMLREWRDKRALAQQRDHRIIGKDQELWMFHDLSPGNAFFLPHGTRIYNTLVAFLRTQYRVLGYEEVMTPLLYQRKLWQTSGHWDNYKDNMYTIANAGEACCAPDADANVPEDEMGLKPMNCPGHCLIFSSKLRSYRDLPMRMADFSPLHRNELSGSLSGLTRLRRFAQDDAHIFCSPEQVEKEILSCLSLVASVYGVLKFDFQIALATRPDNYMGDTEQWDKAEAALESALRSFLAQQGTDATTALTINAGDGAFYGPKVDVTVTDALGRQHQCATVQLDFQLPLKFGLSYKGADGAAHTPVMIHRAVLGSVERFIAVLAEHTGGKWPLWLSPRQVKVCAVGEAHRAYAEEIVANLRGCGFFVDLGDDGSIAKQVKMAQLARYNYVLVVGDREVEAGTVTVRTRDGKVHGSCALADFSARLTEEVQAQTFA